MSKTLLLCLILSTCFTVSCASSDTAERFSEDDCRALTTLFRDQSLNTAAMTDAFDNNLEAAKSPDKFTWPWGKGGRDEDKISKERAAIRKAHSRKTCAP